ncbi:hypothetical protein K440DRAFT_643247 [Wilcoxina mikolae CBS 423.85]|nr:hypothetical protein K440DRAFT_643247 [Wilcoxina mikolae CBS 423.85]
MKKDIQVLLSDPKTYRSSTESSEAAMKDFAALQESPGAPLDVSEVGTEYTIAIQEYPGVPSEALEVAMEYTIVIQKSPQAPLEASEVATEYTNTIQESPGAASRLLGEQGSALRLYSPVPEDSRKVCTVHHSKSTTVTSGGFQGFRDRMSDCANEMKPNVMHSYL